MTDEDKTLLEMAAKAAGLKNYRYCPEEEGLHACIEYDDEDDCTVVWMPHLDDGDALRLAVKLKLHMLHNDNRDAVLWVSAVLDKTMIHGVVEFVYETDRQAATRHAIVRAAAEIGKAMQ